MRLQTSVLATVLFAMYSAPAAAHSNTSTGCAANEFQKLVAGDSVLGGHFGFQVDISGDWGVVGCYGKAYNGNLAGAVYVYKFNGAWNQHSILVPGDNAAVDHFGIAVGIDGDAIVVGAWEHDHGTNDSGAAYVYRYNAGTDTWVEEAELRAFPSPIANEKFGRWAAIHGDLVVVSGPASGNGTAYTYRFNGTSWINEAKFTGSTSFGPAVDVWGDRLILGMYQPSLDGGARVYHFNGTVWSLEATLTAADGSTFAGYGYAVDIQDDVAVVGAFVDDDACPGNIYCESGSAYIYRRAGSAWAQEAKVTASDAAAIDQFGIDVAVRVRRNEQSRSGVCVSAQWNDVERDAEADGLGRRPRPAPWRQCRRSRRSGIPGGTLRQRRV